MSGMKHRGIYSPLWGIVGTVALALSWAMSAQATTAFQSRDLAPNPEWQATQGALAVSGLGLTAGLANPAGARSERASASFSHLLWAGDLSREWAALSVPLGPRFGFVVDAALLHGPQLSGYDDDGAETGSFGVTEWNAGGSVAMEIGAGLGVGVGARVHRLEDLTEPLTGVGISAGARWQTGAQSFGASITDLGSVQSKAEGVPRYDLPTHWRIGAERTMPLYRVGASLRGDEGATVAGFGFSITPTPWVSFLGGLSSGDDSEDGGIAWSSGLQVVHQGIEVGYAVHPAGPLGTTHQFSVTVPLRGDRSPWIPERSSH
ncbi:MAG: hypothetical protein KC729_17620 [Candidatus Eisenbacteria bacterium]|uniref:PorV/PorQ family protein n=1 Tax=Eiseniibacteriota bacterium TaxID=2212470 RepID=A0A956M1C8_UNCEI|nr:hypothetical protein [Candidatus Eisenbacteria bacterium]